MVISMAEAAITPADCAFAVALPLTVAELYRDLERDAPKDFAKSIQREHPDVDPEALWELFYEPIAAQIDEVSAEVEALGVTVVHRATLNDFAELLARYPAVTLITHWRFLPIMPDEIVNPLALLRKLALSTGLVLEHLRDGLFGRLPDLSRPGAAEALGTARLRVVLAEALNALLEPTRRHYEGGEAGREPLGAPPPRVTRVLLEEAFSAEIKRGTAVELYDGLQTVADVVDAVPRGFAGVIDLSVCCSVILGEAIKRRRPDCLVIVNRRLALTYARLLRYKLIIRELTRVARDRFTDVAARVHAAMLSGGT